MQRLRRGTRLRGRKKENGRRKRMTTADGAALSDDTALAHTELERATMARVARRLLPMLIACYFVAYLDRVNVGFAGLTMNKDLGFSSAVFGFGGGIFFLGYFLFEVPSNVILERVGARPWIARIRGTWGLISGCTALAVGQYSFFTIRF